MTGMEGGGAPMGPNMAMLSSMQHQHTPGERVFFLCPPLDYSIGMPAGLMNFKFGPLFFMSAQGGKMGPLSGLSNMFSKCFVDLNTMSAWASAGVEAHSNIEAPYISGIPVEGSPVEGVPITGAEIRAAASSVGFEDMGSSSVSAPKVMAHRSAVASSAGIDI